MSRDLLAEATRALRDSTDAPDDALGAHESRGAETRARVLATVRRRRLRRLTLIKTTLPIAAVLVASAAWASGTGRLEASLRWITAAVAPAAVPAPQPVRATVGGASVRAAAAATEALAVSTGGDGAAAADANADAPLDPLAATVAPSPPPATHASAAPAPRAASARAPAAAAASAPAPAASGAGAPAEDAAEAAELYATAHREHFGARSWSAALTGWEAYLAAAPRGRFATEARYNRAICLARLGRGADARAALEPFARGAFGAYRQREAQALLEALGP